MPRLGLVGRRALGSGPVAAWSMSPVFPAAGCDRRLFRWSVGPVDDFPTSPGLHDGRVADLMVGDVREVGVDDREVRLETFLDGSRHTVEAVHPGAARGVR